MSPGLRIVEVGWATTVQDDGRGGWGHLGVPRAGAIDRRAFDRANRLVGNPPGTASIETHRGFLVEALRPTVVATATARSTLRPGDRIHVEPDDGVNWAYLAVQGGVDVDAVLGSRSHDTLSGVGPPPLETGRELAVGALDVHVELSTELAPVRTSDRPIRVWPGPRTEWFVGGVDALECRPWTVTGDINRVGVRLDAHDFLRAEAAPTGPMGSEGLIEGAIQVTPSGEPIVMLANHPTTGGYPVIAVVDPDDIGRVAQTPPGSTMRFRFA